MISTRNSRSMRLALSRKRRSKNQETSRFLRSSTRSRSCSASFASIIAIQESYTVYVDVWWWRTQVSIESICYLLSTHSPSRTFTSAKTDHVVTDMAKLPDAKNTTRHINLQRNVAKRGTIVSMTGICATSCSGAPWSNTAALNKWSSRWTSLRMRTTASESARTRLSSIAEIGGYTQMWHVMKPCQ